MAVEPIRQLKPMCKAHLKEFADCVSHKETRAHMDVYDREQLLDLDDTSPLKVVLAGQAPLPQTLRQPYPAAPQVFHQRDEMPHGPAQTVQPPHDQDIAALECGKAFGQSGSFGFRARHFVHEDGCCGDALLRERVDLQA